MKQTTGAQPITANSLILEVVENHPRTIAVFSELNMACPGCYISPFHSVTDSAHEYGLHPDELLQALNSALVSKAVSR